MYAVGDVRSNSVKRIASAVGEGSVVIADVHRYLADRKEDSLGRLNGKVISVNVGNSPTEAML
jgi:thioredoxin reductase (NADPH)